MADVLNDFVQRVEEACGKGGDFIAIIRHEKAGEFLEKALRAGEVLYSVPGVMVRVRIRGKEVSVLRTGRSLVKGASNLEEARIILEHIASI